MRVVSTKLGHSTKPVEGPVDSAMVAVVLPIYALELAEDERLALIQLTRVLGRYPRIAAVPQSLPIESLAAEYGLGVERFPDHYFRSVADYNRLMLSREFYQRFERYRYLLIHQLDAFVFRDELAEWCERGYDYIGAPWVARWAFETPWLHRLKSIRATLAREWPGNSRRWLRYAIVNQVGNGGFSLRRTEAFLRVLDQPPSWLTAYRDPASHFFHEDVFWGVAVNRGRQRIRTPDWETALRFAFEERAELAYRHLGERLPFGCHGWFKLNNSFWRPFIEQAIAAAPDNGSPLPARNVLP